MSVPKELTEANWKKVATPMRDIKERLQQPKTGVSAALRKLEKAEKEISGDFLSEKKSKTLTSALGDVKSAIGGLKAKKNKKLMDYCKSMETAAKKYCDDRSKDLRKLKRENIASIPGALAALEDQAGKEFSTENLNFYKDAIKASDMRKISLLYDKYIATNQMNIANEAKFHAVFGAEAEKAMKKELKAAITEVNKNMDDTIRRAIVGCHTQW